MSEFLHGGSPMEKALKMCPPCSWQNINCSVGSLESQADPR
jgi:hypothetical protein